MAIHVNCLYHVMINVTTLALLIADSMYNKVITVSSDVYDDLVKPLMDIYCNLFLPVFLLQN